MPPPTNPHEPAWTLTEAAEFFADGGIPIEEERLRLIIRALKWVPVGEQRVPGMTGRGRPLYPTADLMKLHAAVAPWIASQGPLSGYNPETGDPT